MTTGNRLGALRVNDLRLRARYQGDAPVLPPRAPSCAAFSNVWKAEATREGL
jgi:hypothetical protein